MRTLAAAVILLMPGVAGAVSAWQLSTSANIGLSSYQDSQLADAQSELSFFVDGQYLDGLGIGGGYIRRDRSDTSANGLVTNIIYLGIWKTLYLDMLPGKMSLILDGYRSDGSVDQSGQSKGANVSTQVEIDDMEVISPALVYVNESKSYSVDVSYAESRIYSVTNNLPDVTVRQWVPAVSIIFNDQFDRLRLKYYHVSLSNDSRAAGVNQTAATEVKWTHWFSTNDTGLIDMTLSLLAGDRQYGIDRDTRRIDSFAELLKKAASFGVTWGVNQSSIFYMYAGLERYDDPGVGSHYETGYLYMGTKKKW